MKPYLHKSIFWVLLALGVLLALYAITGVFTHLTTDAYVPGDANSYYDALLFLYQGTNAHPFRPAGYPLIAGIPYLLGARAYQTFNVFNVVLNVLFWLTTVYLFHQTAKRLATLKVANLFTALLIVSIGNNLVTSWFLTESLVTLVFTYMVYYAVKHQNQKVIDVVGMTTGILLLLSLVRPGLQYVALLTFLISFILCVVKKSIPSYHVIIVLVLGIMGWGGQMAYMNRYHHQITLSNIDKQTWYLYLGAQVSDPHTPYEENYKMRKAEWKSIPQWRDRAALADQDRSTAIRTRTSVMMRFYLRNIIGNTFGSANNFGKLPSNPVNKLLMLLSRGYNAFMTALLIFLSFNLMVKFRSLLNGLIPVWHLIIVGIGVYVVLTSGISFYQGDRFHLILFPMILILALDWIETTWIKSTATSI